MQGGKEPDGSGAAPADSLPVLDRDRFGCEDFEGVLSNLNNNDRSSIENGMATSEPGPVFVQQNLSGNVALIDFAENFLRLAGWQWAGCAGSR